jgi:hypothetical protein
MTSKKLSKKPRWTTTTKSCHRLAVKSVVKMVLFCKSLAAVVPQIAGNPPS